MATMTARKSKVAAIPVGENLINDETKVFTDAPRATRQGDLYFVQIPSLPTSAKLRANRHLADGTTQGSRHVCKTGDVYDASADELVVMLKRATKEVVEAKYIGPVFTGPAYIEHPEHGDHDFQCEGVFVVVTQRSLDADERAQRVLD